MERGGDGVAPGRVYRGLGPRLRGGDGMASGVTELRGRRFTGVWAPAGAGVTGWMASGVAEFARGETYGGLGPCLRRDDGGNGARG